jgi:hypothetical protein
MTLYEKIIDFYPELNDSNLFADGTITLQDDSDGQGAYIREWNYSQPIPDGLTLGKPSA